jgi:hypothetical protein
MRFRAVLIASAQGKVAALLGVAMPAAHEPGGGPEDPVAQGFRLSTASRCSRWGCSRTCTRRRTGGPGLPFQSAGRPAQVAKCGCPTSGCPISRLI